MTQQTELADNNKPIKAIFIEEMVGKNYSQSNRELVIIGKAATKKLCLHHCS